MLEPLPNSTQVAGYIRWRLKQTKSPYVDNVTYINRVMFFSYACALMLGFRLCDESPRWCEYGFTFINPIVEFNDSHETSGLFPTFALEGFPKDQQENIQHAVDSGLKMIGELSTKTLIQIQRTIPRWKVEDNRRKVRSAEERENPLLAYSLPDKELVEWMQSVPIIA